jgi:UDP-N-acetylmuramoyl-L-alanyl-D-glutamate--2,6-diaminopimelate ligase
LRLDDLVRNDLALRSGGHIEVTGLTADSRESAPGVLFAALPGTRRDGRTYIVEAVARGAVAVLAPPGTRLPEGLSDVALLIHDNPRGQLARMAARFYGQQPAIVAAVTGTSGKTSVVDFTRQIWSQLGRSAASIGTLGAVRAGRPTQATLTTPDPVSLHRLLAEMAADGVDRLSIEASSHGLDQGRLDGLRVTVGAFTNLSRDHLDYHPNMEAYFAAKRALFDRIMSPGGNAVVNADDPRYAELARVCLSRGHRLLSYGRRPGADLRLLANHPDRAGQTVSIEIFGRRREVRLPLIGAFQAGNVLAAVGLALAAGEDIETVLAALPRLGGVPGRMQDVVTTATGATVIVDYAHKPDALETVLKAMRPHVEGRLWLVFGCGGDRDPGKRPMMGELAMRLADRIVVTDDNPRSEDPAAIRCQILAACPGAEEIGDRAEAIRRAVRALADGDLLVIAGKGHEQGQIVGSEVRPFDDVAVARAAATALGAAA